MAILFDDASSENLQNDAAVVTAVPLSMAAWFRTNDLTIVQAILSFSNRTSGSGDAFVLRMNGTVANDPIEATTNAGGAASSAQKTGTSVNTWHHAGGVFSAINNRVAYLDGVAGTANTTSRTPSGIDTTNIGLRYSGTTPGQYFSGDICEVAAWSVALATADMEILAKGYSPLFVRPDSLVFYASLIGNYSPEIDLVGGFNMTWNNSPVKSDHPRIIYPKRRKILVPGAAAAAGSVPLFYHHLQTQGQAA